MRAVVTRVKSASCTVEGAVTGNIGAGYLVLLGIGPEDTADTAARMADKVCKLRVFSDENGKMNLDLAAAGGALLVISQFTLYADVRSRRPSFIGAAGPELAEPLYQYFCDVCRDKGFEVQQGVFGAHMEVASVNDGPVTILFEL